jgi:hypothetical protein
MSLQGLDGGSTAELAGAVVVPLQELADGFVGHGVLGEALEHREEEEAVSVPHGEHALAVAVFCGEPAQDRRDEAESEQGNPSAVLDVPGGRNRRL